MQAQGLIPSTRCDQHRGTQDRRAHRMDGFLRPADCVELDRSLSPSRTHPAGHLKTHGPARPWKPSQDRPVIENDHQQRAGAYGGPASGSLAGPAQFAWGKGLVPVEVEAASAVDSVRISAKRDSPRPAVWLSKRSAQSGNKSRRLCSSLAQRPRRPRASSLGQARPVGNRARKLSWRLSGSS